MTDIVAAITLLVSAYLTAIETQAELTVQAAGYDQVTAHCRLAECSWVGRSKLTGGWETGTAWCDPFTLDCEVRR